MKKNKRLFCKLIATGMYDARRAVETVWADKYDDTTKQGRYLMSQSKVLDYISELKQSNALLADANNTWIRTVLVDLVERSSSLEGEAYDPTVIRYALDMLNKMNGNYEKDNQQRQEVTLSMHF